MFGPPFTLQKVIWLWSVVGVIAVYQGYVIFRGWQKRKLRQKLATDGRLTSAATPRNSRQWLLTLLIAVPCVVLGVGSTVYPQINIVMHDWRVWIGVFLVISVIAFIVNLVRAKSSDPVINEAKSLVKRAENDKAISVLRQAMATAPTPDRADALGGILYRCQRWNDAGEACQEAVRLGGAKSEYAALAAMSFAKAERFAEGLTIVEAARKGHPEQATLAYAAALLLAGLGRNEEADEQVRQAEELIRCALDQQDTSAWYYAELRRQCREWISQRSTRGFP